MIPVEAVPDVRPIAIGEVWSRLASMCTSAMLSEVGPALQPHAKLAALHKRMRRNPSVLATNACYTVQHIVTSIDASVPMHVSSIFLSPIFQLDAVATKHSQRCCSFETLFRHEATQARASLIRVCACDVNKSNTVTINVCQMHALPSQAL